MLRTILMPLSAIVLTACGTPKEAIRLSDLVVADAEIMKRDIEAYAGAVNASRAAAAARLSEMSAQTALRSRRSEGNVLSWKLAGNKRAVDMLKHIRSLDAAKPTDVYTIAGIQTKIEGDLRKRFGRVKADTAAYSEMIKKSKAAVKPDRQAVLSIALKIFGGLAKATDATEGRIKNLLETAEDAANKAAKNLEKGTRPAKDGSGD